MDRRDFYGYGNHRPQVRWPNGAGLALNFVLNVEEGAELSLADGGTRTRKVRRGFIADKYAVLIDALYTGRSEQFIETQVKFEDGRTGMVSATLKIADAKTFPTMKKAA